MTERLSVDELKRQVSLRDVAAGVVKLEKRGEEYWACCPFHEEKTASFAIKMKDGAEVFFCQGCGKGGSVVDFLMLREHLDQKGAFKRLHELAGDTEWKEAAKKVQESFQAVGEPERKTFPVTAWAAKEKALLASAEGMHFLNVKRGINTETVKACRFGYAQSLPEYSKLPPEDEDARDKGWICMPRIQGEKVIAVKMRSIFKKTFVQSAHMNPKALFNTETINALEPVFVTEGEFDTAIMEQAGFRAVSIPNANQGMKVTPEWKEQLMRAPARYLAGDNDGKVGSEAMRNLHRELGTNTFLLLWPDAKDANEFFLKNCNGPFAVELFRSEVEKLMAVGRSTPVEGFTSLLQRLRTTMGSDGANDPYRLHFKIRELDEMAYVPSGTVCVIYSTYSGTGKSVFVNQAMLDEGKRGEVVVVFSPELAGANYLALVAAQVLDNKLINRSLVVSQQDYRETADRLDEPTERGSDFQFYVGHTLPEGDPLDFIENTVKVTGATRFVIDTLHRVVITNGRQSTSDAEAAMMKRLEKIAKQYGCIFILVGQSNKEAEDLKEKRRDAKGVLRGSREIFDVAHAVYLIHRKKKGDDATDKTDLLEEETVVTMEKNRTSGPGQQLVKLRYVRAHSRFYLQDRGDSGNIEQSAPPEMTDGEQPY
jgi:KaiC/GvpD/RAD55 family RecA-like ATPase